MAGGTDFIFAADAMIFNADGLGQAPQAARQPDADHQRILLFEVAAGHVTSIHEAATDER